MGNAAGQDLAMSSALSSQAGPHGMLHSLLQQLRQGARERRAESGAGPGTGRGLVVAFTSANSGEGVTHTVETLLRELGRDASSRTLRVESAALRSLDTDAASLRAALMSRCRPLLDPASSRAAASAPLWELAAAPEDGSPDGHRWNSSWELRSHTIAHLRTLFDYVLVDCPALRTGNDILAVAPFVDGVMLVVEANRTRREQILHAQKTIEFARGKVLGHILNKRSYAVPDWLYRRL